MEINLSILGSGRIIKYFSLDSPLYRRIGHLNPNEIQSILYSDEFQSLGLDHINGKRASTFFEVNPDQQYIAYDLDRITRLEIKIKGKVRNKIFFQEITSEGLLFPLYNFNLNKLPHSMENGLIIIENDIGHFGRCRLNLDSFDVNNLNFDLIDVGMSMKSIVLKICYDGNELVFRKRESLFNGNVVIVKH